MTDRTHWSRALAGGVFLACSWTWCIGMFLPVYLVRDFGWPGWAAFALPNVVGAALVGWVWRRAGSSGAFVAHNEGAMRLFSAWTVLFHFAFLGWMLAGVSQSMMNDWASGGFAAVLILLAAVFLAALGEVGHLRLAAFTLVASLAMLLGATLTSNTLRLPPARGAIEPINLAYAFPLIAFGFLLCPHLDLTLHRVRQRLPGRSGTAAFLLGFGVLFPGMIAFTLLYADSMSNGSYSFYTIAHIVAQSLFTMTVHLRELFERGVAFRAGRPGADPVRRRALGVGVASLCVVIVMSLVVAIAERWVPSRIQPRFSPRELFYKVFLGAYALAFPAWMWIVGVRRGASGRARIVAWLGAIAVGAPALWMGLIQGPILGAPARWYWLLPLGVGVSALAPLALRRRAGQRPEAR